MSGMPTYELGARSEIIEFAPGWELVVGLEVHTELKTKTKLFCGCRNGFGAAPNQNTCPVCLGLPGSLPVLNRVAVEFAIRIGLALHCSVSDSIFHRKNYFYPDMPKDYQISQYDTPINRKGYLELPSGMRVGIERAHLEEDTGKIIHVGGGGRIASSDSSLIDYNRSGIPLVEIVSSPDIATADQAREYVNELRSILILVGASDGKMEEGSLRVDANVSVRPSGSGELRTRCEIKNVNSLRSLGRAITFEAHRHIALYEAGESPTQQTRYWDEAKGVTGALRDKEEADDYRYFPEPDLVPLLPSSEWIEEIRAGLPELPNERRGGLVARLGLAQTNDQIEKSISPELYSFVHQAIEGGLDAKLVVARAANELAALLPLPPWFSPERFEDICRREQSGALTSTQAKALLARAVQSDDPLDAIVVELGLINLGGDELTPMVLEVIEANATEWERFRSGEDQLQGFFVGAIMKRSKGKADGRKVGQILLDLKAK